MTSRNLTAKQLMNLRSELTKDEAILCVNFRKIRLKKGYTQKDIANLLQVGHSTIKCIEAGYQVPTILHIQKFKQKMKVSYDDIFANFESKK